MSEDVTQPQADYTQDMLFTEGLPALDPKLGYRGIPAASAAGISYRQLDYWDRTGLVQPTVRHASGSGSQRLYAFRDILVLKLVKRLLDTGQRPDFVGHIRLFGQEFTIADRIRQPLRRTCDNTDTPLQ